MSKLFSLIFLICFSPILLIFTIVIIVDDGFPILFRQKRVGQNNALFWIYKFRTMKKNAPDIATHLLKDGTSLYTSTGPFLRKISLDELPQLFNILKGDMIFIGPRPALFNQDDLIKLRTEKGINQLKPGITGWAQVNGRDELSIPDKVKMDEYYLKNRSVMLNIKIIFLTLLKIFMADGVKK